MEIDLKQKFIEFYSKIAYETSLLSYATKLKVGAILVKDDNIISFGYNGTAPGKDNNCEDKVIIEDPVKIEYLKWLMNNDAISPYFFDNGISFRRTYRRKQSYTYEFYQLVTKPEVIHAEHNCLSKVAKSNNSSQGATMFLTHSPCFQCSKNILLSGISSVYYNNEYRSLDGVKYLNDHGVECKESGGVIIK